MVKYLLSPCCDAAVMVDITVHPRYRANGSVGPIVDSFAGIKRDVARSAAPEPHEAYCAECGSSVDVPHQCDEPWLHEAEDDD